MFPLIPGALHFRLIWNVSAEPLKFTVGFLVLALARRRTLPSLTGPSADEGHRNVRAAPAFDPSAGRVWDQEDSASLRGAQTRGGHSPSRFSRDGIITHTRVAKLLQWKLKNQSPFSFFLCDSISLTLSLPPPILFFFFSFCLLPNDLESSGTASWSWREAEPRATLEWLIREIRVVLLSSPYVFRSKQEQLFVG